MYNTALQAAAEHDHVQVVQLLLDRGAEINIEGGGHCSSFTTALEAALTAGSEKVVQLMLDRGAHSDTQAGA